MADDLVKEEEFRRRPFGLYMIVALQLLIVVVLASSLLGYEDLYPYLRWFIGDANFYLVVGWSIVALLLISVYGLLRLKRWGWVLTMVLTGIGLLSGIWAYFQGNFNYVAMIVYIVIVFYLNQRDVQSPFERRSYRQGAA